ETVVASPLRVVAVAFWSSAAPALAGEGASVTIVSLEAHAVSRRRDRAIPAIWGLDMGIHAGWWSRRTIREGNSVVFGTCNDGGKPLQMADLRGRAVDSIPQTERRSHATHIQRGVGSEDRGRATHCPDSGRIQSCTCI